MILSEHNLKRVSVPGLQMPGENAFDLPEKVLQFGTGVLLRGLPDYFIDKANRQGIFNGRIVVVKSTDTGSATDFDKQDNLYTIYLKGVENNQEINEQVICSSISRVLSAADQWDEILNFAKSPDLEVVISNTIEIGIQLIKEDIHQTPPASFPGKLLVVLYQRYQSFMGDVNKGLVIIPTELIIDNGKRLEAILLELANFNKLEPAFIDWLKTHNTFCDSLVDRIVPGKPDKTTAKEMEIARGYSDDLHIMAETYGLWAIEGDEKVAAKLSFSKADKGVVITPDIELFRELKLRLLNGSHTLSCAVAVLSGFDTVKEAMDNEEFVHFITQLAYKEIIPAIPYKIPYQTAADFAGSVLDRFRNPNIKHEWISISTQYSAKLKMRVIPILLNHYNLHKTVPPFMALGFAAYLRFMKVKLNNDGKYTGLVNGKEYIVTDAQAPYFYEVWKSTDDTGLVVEKVLKNKDLWGSDLRALHGFAKAVETNLNKLIAGTKVLV